MRHEKIYYLMHCNDIVTTLSFDEITGNIVSVGKSKDEKLLPLGGNRTQDDLKKWWERRAVPLKQGNIKHLLNANNIATPQNFLLQNLGLSLSDHYWINPINLLLDWKNVNLFTNDFKDEFGEFRFKDSFSSENMKINLKCRTKFCPSASLQGDLQKKWVLQDGKRYLVKGNYGISCQQSINEAIASMLHEKQRKMPYTKYRLCDIEVTNEKAIGCVCEDFCTEEVEFLPAYDVLASEKKSNEQSDYEQFISICGKHGLDVDEVRMFLEYEILTDFVITNVDRHLYNFGVLRDTKTLKFIGMAPIFDSGNSLFWNRRTVPKGQELLNISVNSFKSTETELLKYVKDVKLVELDKLPSRQELEELLLLDKECEIRMDAVLNGYSEKLNLLENLQNGDKIYQYGYKIR